uniref:Uncharacterized protein n=1 Tax=Globodera rostochiensis TaxID=31243 RepID=A0A914I1D4_GLORO
MCCNGCTDMWMCCCCCQVTKGAQAVAWICLDLAKLPIRKMGVFKDYVKSLIDIGLGPQRELEPQAAQLPAFDNPFKQKNAGASTSVSSYGSYGVDSVQRRRAVSEAAGIQRPWGLMAYHFGTVDEEDNDELEGEQNQQQQTVMENEEVEQYNAYRNQHSFSMKDAQKEATSRSPSSIVSICSSVLVVPKTPPDTSRQTLSTNGSIRSNGLEKFRTKASWIALAVPTSSSKNADLHL